MALTLTHAIIKKAAEIVDAREAAKRRRSIRASIALDKTPLSRRVMSVEERALDPAYEEEEPQEKEEGTSIADTATEADTEGGEQERGSGLLGADEEEVKEDSLAGADGGESEGGSDLIGAEGAGGEEGSELTVTGAGEDDEGDDLTGEDGGEREKVSKLTGRQATATDGQKLTEQGQDGQKKRQPVDDEELSEGEEEQQDEDHQSPGKRHGSAQDATDAPGRSAEAGGAASSSEVDSSPVDNPHEEDFELQDDERLAAGLGPFDAGDHAVQGAEDPSDYGSSPVTDGPAGSAVIDPGSPDSVEASRREHRPGAAVGTRQEPASFDAGVDTEACAPSDATEPADGKTVRLPVAAGQDASDGPTDGGEDVFEWLRRVSTQMDDMGITEQLRVKYGDKPRVVCDNPSGAASGPAEVPSITITDSTTTVSHRQSATQTEAPPEESPTERSGGRGDRQGDWQTSGGAQGRWTDRRGSRQDRPTDWDRDGYRKQQQQEQQQQWGYGRRYEDRWADGGGPARRSNSNGGGRNPRGDRRYRVGERGGGGGLGRDTWDSDEFRGEEDGGCGGGSPGDWSGEWPDLRDSGADGEAGRPCGQCRCCRAMLRAVGGHTAAAEPPPLPPPQPQDGEPSLSSQQDSVLEQLRSAAVGSAEDLLDAEMSSLTTSTGTANSCDDGAGPGDRQRDRDPRRWIKSVTDDFLRSQNIRELVLNKDCVEPGRVRSKMTRVMRCRPRPPPPLPMGCPPLGRPPPPLPPLEPRQDCAAGARGDRRRERRSPVRPLKGAWSPGRSARSGCSRRPLTAPCGGGGRQSAAVSPPRISTRLMDGRELGNCGGAGGSAAAAAAANPTRQFIETYLERTGQAAHNARKRGSGRTKRSEPKTKRLITISTNLKT